MGRSRLRKRLEYRAGEEKLDFVIPHALLPPRFRDGGENLILQLDLDFKLRVFAQNNHLVEPRYLTKAEARRLIEDVLRNLNNYRKDLEIFSRFIQAVAEQPGAGESNGKCKEEKAAQRAKETGAEEEEATEIEREEDLQGQEIIAVVPIIGAGTVPSSEDGGESPCPDWEW